MSSIYLGFETAISQEAQQLGIGLIIQPNGSVGRYLMDRGGALSTDIDPDDMLVP